MKKVYRKVRNRINSHDEIRGNMSDQDMLYLLNYFQDKIWDLGLIMESIIERLEENTRESPTNDFTVEEYLQNLNKNMSLPLMIESQSGREQVI